MKRFFPFFPKIKGMATLVAVFKAKPFPNERIIQKTTVKVGSVRYRKCASLFIDEKGLYLSVSYIFKAYPTIFIPWSTIENAGETTLYGMKAMQFRFIDSDTPSVICYKKDLQALNFEMVTNLP